MVGIMRSVELGYSYLACPVSWRKSRVEPLHLNGGFPKSGPQNKVPLIIGNSHIDTILTKTQQHTTSTRKVHGIGRLGSACLPPPARTHVSMKVC